MRKAEKGLASLRASLLCACGPGGIDEGIVGGAIGRS